MGRDERRLEATAEISRRTADCVLVHNADLSADCAVVALAQRVEKEFKALDVLVHCAGVHSTGSLEKTPVQQLDVLYRTNFRMPFALTQALLPLLKSQQGQIVFVNSSQGLQAKRNTGFFAATQHASTREIDL